MNKKTANLLYIILIVAVICFMIIIIFWLQSEGKSCLTNPVRYFYDRNPEISCNCYWKNWEIVEGLSRNDMFNQP